MKRIIVLLLFLFLPLVVHAAVNKYGCEVGSEADKTGKVCLDNPLPYTEFTSIAGTIIKGMLGIIGSLTLLMFVWGGFQWLTSAGNAEKVESGSKTMIWAAIGVLLVFTSFFLIQTFTNFLSKGTP